MPEAAEASKEVSIADVVPDLSGAEQEEARQALDDYCELLFQIFERRERQRSDTFDESVVDSYHEIKVDSRNK
jgi:hypothetical protein